MSRQGKKHTRDIIHMYGTSKVITRHVKYYDTI